MENRTIKEWGYRFYGWDNVIGCLPSGVRREILHIGASRKGFPKGLSEIRLRAFGVCSLIFSGERMGLVSRVSEAELAEVLARITDGSLYSYRDTLKEGYVPLPYGVRVGVTGHSRYDGGETVGIHGISAMVFRLPFGECNFAGELARLFLEKARAGMLIYAPPGGGKTTALRSLVRILSSGDFAKRVAVIDERCEFIQEDYLRCEADILRGYKRADGIEIAARTMNPEIIVIDEIGAKEVGGLLSVMRCGIPVIATVHAQDTDELFMKPGVRALIRAGVFDLFLGIVKKENEYGFVATCASELGKDE